jgi:cell division protein FtsB
MSDVDAAKKRLAEAVKGLDKVLKARVDEAGANAARQIAELSADAEARTSEIEALRLENTQMKADIATARGDYSALEEVAETVEARLGTAIGGIRTVLDQ